MKYGDALKLIGGLSNTSKMPWYSWSTSAFDCQTGSKLRQVEGSTCSSCYAMKGFYTFKNVKEAHDRKLLALQDPNFVEAFVVVLTQLHKQGRKTYQDPVLGEIKENRFRWHDSGDIQSVDHLKMINEIAKRTPQIKHWLPTREFAMVDEYLKEGNTFVDNLTVRMSAVMIGKSFPQRPMGLPYSTVGVTDASVKPCPAYDQDGQCKNCQTCWNKESDVNYPLH